ncbi:MAG TPA: hypothetical protein VNX21_09420 [Candidatus Thermoplasmatota archaeon]|nr:hypothetical protein [Candidatus Thermoplasmatota archaeon]
MRRERRGPGALARLAPIAFVAGILLLGLGLLVFSLAAGWAQPRVIEYREEGVANGTAYVAYPVPFEGRSDLRLDVSFRFPETGVAFLADCRAFAAFKEGGQPASPVRSAGASGSFSTSMPGGEGPFAGEGGCPFAYVVLAWPAPGGEAGSARPEAEVVVSSILADEPVGALAVASTLLGALLASLGGVAWGRRLRRGPPPAAVPGDESTAEALLHAVERGGHWLERTRRYLVAAGVLGVFLWYPVLLPWAWRTALRGTRERWLPWTLAGGAVVLLLVLTVVWSLEYVRIERELAAWRERVARLRQREAALLGVDGVG